MMAQGLGYAEIADALGTTQEAVDSQVTGAVPAGWPATAPARDSSTSSSASTRPSSSRPTSRKTLASFVPQQLADRLAAQPEMAIEPQEVEVSVLFSDIRGFSTLAERLSARDVAEVVGKHLSAMAEVVLSLGGMIDKFQGDAVMVVFGAPEPTSDHAERALSCAIAMQARQAELNAEGWGLDVPKLGVGIGVNTGSVIAGTVGGGGRLEYTVVGDAVNIAQRLQSEAEGGEVVAAASTVAAAPGVVCESIGARYVKGREEPVEVFRVVIE